MRTERSLNFSLVLSVVAAAAGCGAARTPILVPPEAVREWTYLPDGTAGTGRYVIRMTDGKREWEVEFPEALYGSEVRVPLRDGAQLQTAAERAGLTAADRELEEDRNAAERAMEGEDPATPGAVGARKAPAAATTPAGAAPAGASAAPAAKPGRGKASYLVGVAQVKELYRTRNYEIALVQLVDLERDYPNDEKLLAMKGSIYRRMGKNRLARETWERVLTLNPDNATVAAALRELAEEEEKAGVIRDRPMEEDDEVGPSPLPPGPTPSRTPPAAPRPRAPRAR